MDFDFGWKKWQSIPSYVELVFWYQRGDVLDVGCGPCQLNKFLKSKGWRGKYYGIDIKKYKSCQNSKEVKFIVGDALNLEFPKTDTIVLYNILEHVEDPVKLLAKAVSATKNNVLINVPKRNEEMWSYGIVEYHQLDKSHKHCGFSKKEVYNLVNLAGGKIVTYKELGKIDATISLPLWNNIIPKAVIYLLDKLFSSKTFYSSIWCEIIKK